MAARYLLPALAVAGRAAAASCGGTTTISSQAEATQVAQCNQWNGNIVIASSTNGDIDMSGLQRIDGSLSLARNAQSITSLTADTLSEISDSFTINTASSLSSLTFPSLVSVGAIDWSGLPVLSGLSFTQTVQSADTVSIVNTNLNSLEGINLMKIGQLTLADNSQLSEVNMQLTNVTSGIIIASNGQYTHTSVSFPNLKACHNLTIQNVASIELSSLGSVVAAMGFRDNYFSSLSLPNLTAVGQTLSIQDNDDLTSLNFPEIYEIGGGLVIANNTKLTAIDGFDRLKNVFSNVMLSGVFKTVSLPKLNYVRGAFYVASTANINSVCNHFQSVKNGEIYGPLTCKSGDSSARSQGGHSGSGSGSGSSGSGGSSGSNNSGGSSGAGSLIIPYATGIIGVVAAVFGML